MNRLIVIVGLAFVGGLAIGGAAAWLVLDQGAAQPSSRLAGLGIPSPSPDVPSAPRVVEDAPYRSASGSRPADGGIHPKKFDEAAALGDLDQLPTTGTGTITGRIKTDKGEALAGVVVRAEYQGERQSRRQGEWKTGDGVPPESDTPEAIQRYFDQLARSRAMRREAVTGENGEFTLTGLLDDRYGVQAYLKGYIITSDRRDLQWSARPGVAVDFTAAKVLIVPIDVRLADGSTPKRAQVQIRVHNNTNNEEWRPNRAEIRLGAGSYALSVTAGDHDEWRSESQNVVLKEDATPTPLSFRLTARTGIHGRVVVPKGYAVDGISIFALRYAGSAVPDENSLKQGQNSWANQWNGYEFTIHDLAPGTWMLGAGTWESIFTTKSVEVASGVVTEVVLEITDAGQSGLLVKVLAPDGSPVADAQVRVYGAGQQWDSPEGFTVRPKKDGGWSIVAKKEQAGDVKEWFINVNSERYGEKVVPLPVPATGELRIDFAETASLEVTINGYAGSGLEGRLGIDVRSLAGKESARRYYYGREDQQIGPDGRMIVKPLQPGRYRVELQYKQQRWNSSPLDRVDVDVVAGANSCAMPVPAVYTLNVSCGADAAEGWLNLNPIGGGEERGGSHARVGADGNATFEGVTAGTYRLSLYGQKSRRQKSMKVTVPATGPISFKEDVETALVLKGLDAEGYLASAGLQTGDVITGAEGSEFDGSRPATTVMTGLLSARKELKIRFTRSGKSSEVTVDSEKFSVATKHMSLLEPGTR
jgi:hypothetical protein